MNGALRREFINWLEAGWARRELIQSHRFRTPDDSADGRDVETPEACFGLAEIEAVHGQAEDGMGRSALESAQTDEHFPVASNSAVL
ncbi:MAG: hypothetical protein Kow0059_06890 [Candidatus Sumerlaeia bacterium]